MKEICRSSLFRTWMRHVIGQRGYFWMRANSIPAEFWTVCGKDWIARRMRYILTAFRVTKRARRCFGHCRPVCSSDLRATLPGGTGRMTWWLGVRRGRWCCGRPRWLATTITFWTGDLSRTGAYAWLLARLETLRRGQLPPNRLAETWGTPRIRQKITAS